MKDEHGMPKPIYSHGPYKIVSYDGMEHPHTHVIVDGENNVVFPVVQHDLSEFFVHAANHFDECRDIVRRLAKSKGVSDLLKITVDASILWAKMQEGAKGDE